MKRKEFLKLSGSLALAGMASPALVACMNDTVKSETQKSFGLQLYTLRAEMPSDPKGILKQVASFGYKEIESYEGPQGMFWGMGNTGFRSYMDELGMNLVASHCDIYKDFEKKANEAAAIGMNYLVCPSINLPKDLEGLKNYVTLFNECGLTCKKAGLKFAFHNHDGEFSKAGEHIILEFLLDNTDPELVDFEMDIYWVVTAGQDPVVWLKRYPNRFRLCHVKDRIIGSTERNASCDLGKGSIDFRKILKTAQEKGMMHYIVEQERYDGTTPLKAVESGAGYLKKIIH